MKSKIKTKILIVDDHHENIVALSELIKSDDIEIFSALNAEEALELISRHDFGLLLLDVQMPITSGFELAQIIRSVKKYRNLPIIFVTASQEDSALIYKGYQSGAVDLLFKPLDPNVVRAKVRTFVAMAEQKMLLQKHVEELGRLRIEAEAANIAKSQFLASMSHEIRTPLSAVLGFSELLYTNHNSEEKVSELKEAIKRNGSLLMRIIDDVLNLSKIEAGQLELETKDFDIKTFFEDIKSTLLFRAKEKGLSLVFKFNKELKGVYKGDPLRLKQIFLNIIGNSIKFTEKGEVLVDINFKNHSSTMGSFVVDVTDQGIGLTPMQMERLFKPFAQADSSTQRLFGGSGLGLVISKQIALAMGGDIELVSSTPNQGSVFRITFNLQVGNKENVQIVEETDTSLKDKHKSLLMLKNKKLLAVDDAQDNLTLISLYLQKTGVQLTVVDNALKAIEKVKNEDFDLILMDIQMPVMDGRKATQEIRQLGYNKPIIAFTAHAIESEQEKCISAGCNSVITKPINQKTLLNTVGSYLESPPV